MKNMRNKTLENWRYSDHNISDNIDEIKQRLRRTEETACHLIETNKIKDFINNNDEILQDFANQKIKSYDCRERLSEYSSVTLLKKKMKISNILIHKLLRSNISLKKQISSLKTERTQGRDQDSKTLQKEYSPLELQSQSPIIRLAKTLDIKLDLPLS